MRIEVRALTHEFDEQTRAYAEFRIFSALARFSRQIDAVTVLLGHSAALRDSVNCTTSIAFVGGGRLRLRAPGCHAYDAINRAVDGISDLLEDGHSGRVAVTDATASIEDVRGTREPPHG